MTDQGPASPKDARRQARGDKAARKAQRNWFARHKILTGIGVLVLLGIIAGIANSGKSGSTATVTPAASSAAASAAATKAPAAPAQPKGIAHAEDVAITDCVADDAGYAASKVVVTNHSSKPSNYIIEIAFESKDGKTQVGTGTVAVNSLTAGQVSSPQDANSLAKAPAGGYTCKLAQLTRYSSGG